MPRVSYLLIKLLTLCELKYGNTCIDLLGSRLSRISIINPMRTRLAYLLTFGCLEYHMAYILAGGWTITCISGLERHVYYVLSSETSFIYMSQ